MPTPNRPELGILRGKTGPESISQWTDAFAGGDRATAERYMAAISRFTGSPEPGSAYEPYMGVYSPATRRAYAYALTEFFEWLAAKHGRIVAPPEVTRKDAEDYVQWLTARPYSLEGERLRDGDQRERLALYEIVRELGSADILSIAARAPGWLVTAHPSRVESNKIDRAWLNRELGRMVLHDLLVRSPTIEELRREDARIGISVFSVMIPSGEATREVPLDEIFSYSPPKPRAVSRSTVSVRLAALSSFWSALASGENATGKQGALLQHNIFADLAARVRKGMAADGRAAAARKGRLTPQMVERLLQAVDGPSLAEKRDAALLWFLVLTGTRVTETTRIRRDRPPAAEAQRWPGWYDGRALPPTVELVRKGGFRQRLPYPPYALKALHVFQSELAKHVPLEGMQGDDPARMHYLPPTSPSWRYKALAEEPDAPLFPPVNFWGANATHNYQEFKPNSNVRPDYRRAMTRHGVDAMLKRVAKKAGFTEEEQALVHGHAFRHFAATAMAKQGKPLREIQHILGHGSVTTTERYVEAETRPEALSGQNEILDYIATGVVREPPAPAEPEPPRQPPTRAPRVIETYGAPARPERPTRARPKRERLPGGKPPEEALPAQSPRVSPDATVVTEHGLVAIAPGGPEPPPGSEIRHGVSPPSPVWAYAGRGPLLRGQTPEDRVAQQEKLEFSRGQRRSGSRGITLRKKKDTEIVQANPWLAKNYDPWPLNYGIGASSLLPWFARGSGDANGEVTVEVGLDKKVVVVPPIPVLSPYQTDPSLAPTHAKLLWQKVEEMRVRWLRTSPSRAFGLDRWWGAFLKITNGLSTGTMSRFPWVPFDAPAKFKKEVRAHDEEYLVEWLEINADRYTTTVRAFESIARLRGQSETDVDEWREFQRTWLDVSVTGVSPAEELPDWFIVDDPVRDIYDKNPEEWEWFAQWIGAVTGQKLSPVREAALKTEVAVEATERAARIQQARVLLAEYYDAVAEQHRTVGAGRNEGRMMLKLLTDKLSEEYGVPDPAVMLKEGKLQKRSRREAKIEQLLSMAFPGADVAEVDPNVLRSKLFDADTLRLDMEKRTISHTDSFRKEFADRYDGRDSECVVRRAARGMWEYVKRTGIPVKRGAERASQYSMIYSVMLSYMAWIFPCPEEIERRMAATTEAELPAAEARLVWLNGVRSTARGIVTVTEDRSEDDLRWLAGQKGLDRKSADEVIEAALVADSLRAEVALPSPVVAAAIAHSDVQSGQVIVKAGGSVQIRPTVRKRVKQASEAPEQPSKPAQAEAKRPVAPERVPEVRGVPGRRGAVVELSPEHKPVSTYFSSEEAPEPEQTEAPEPQHAGGFPSEEFEEDYEEQEGEGWLARVEEEPAVAVREGLQEERWRTEKGLEQNQRPDRYMTLGAFRAGADYVANAEQVLPTALRMMAAMTLPF